MQTSKIIRLGLLLLCGLALIRSLPAEWRPSQLTFVNELSGAFLRESSAALPLLLTGIPLLQWVIAVMLAFAVKADAEKKRLGPRGLFLLSPWMWFAVVLMANSYLGALGYWLIHYSALRHRADSET